MDSVETQEAVLGAALINRVALLKVMSSLQEEDFTTLETRSVFKAVASLYRQDIPVDIVTVSDEIKKAQLKDGSGYITKLYQSYGTSTFVDSYIDLLLEARAKRALKMLIGFSGEKAEKEKTEDVVGYLQENLPGVLPENNSGEISASSMFEVLPDWKTKHYISTKIEPLDKLLCGGYYEGQFILLGARPSLGKTALALQSAVELAKDRPVLYLSYEMTRSMLRDRLYAYISGVNLKHIRMRELTEDDYAMLRVAQAELRETTSNLLLYDRVDLNIHQLLSKISVLSQKKNIAAVFIDYLGLVPVPGIKDEYPRMTYLSRQMQSIARKTNIPIIALHQLSRAGRERKEKFPILEDLRGSGSLEQDADVVIFIHKEKEEAGGVQVLSYYLLCAKYRDGQIGKEYVDFNGSVMRFT